MRHTMVILLLGVGCNDMAMSSGADGFTSGEPQPGAEPGTLTAGAWDDNENFDYYEAYVAEVEARGLDGLPHFEPGLRVEAHHRSRAVPAARQRLDVALVVDTTGSMSDELSYLQVEFDALTERIAGEWPDADQRWAMVVYRDEGDAYVTREEDFTADLAGFRARLARQSSDGGGDYPEAPDQALREALDLSWRTSADAARLLFWVADAPHHSGDEGRMVEAVDTAVERGVHVYPVAASGTDDLTEFTMRGAAQATLGRYLFLTDDSGIGGEHKEPDVPCYFVTRLDHQILRMVDIEMSGVYREPHPENIIRTGGDPEDRACQLEGGGTVRAF